MLFVGRRRRSWVNQMSAHDLLLVEPSYDIPESHIASQGWIRVVMQASDRVAPIKTGDIAVSRDAQADVLFFRRD